MNIIITSDRIKFYFIYFVIATINKLSHGYTALLSKSAVTRKKIKK